MLLLRKLLKQDSELFMGSLDVDSLFTNSPIEAAIDICANASFENREKVEGLSKIELKELLSVATNKSHFVFKEKLYKQVNGVTMCPPLGPLLANTFLVHSEKNWLQNCLSDFKLHYYRQYVDDLCFIHLTKTFRSLLRFSKR